MQREKVPMLQFPEGGVETTRSTIIGDQVLDRIHRGHLHHDPGAPLRRHEVRCSIPWTSSRSMYAEREACQRSSRSGERRAQESRACLREGFPRGDLLGEEGDGRPVFHISPASPCVYTRLKTGETLSLNLEESRLENESLEEACQAQKSGPIMCSLRTAKSLLTGGGRTCSLVRTFRIQK